MNEVVNIKLELNLNSVNFIMKALDEMPYKYSAPIIANITKQAQPQVSYTAPVVEDVAEDVAEDVES
jgi:hypothetical protein